MAKESAPPVSKSRKARDGQETLKQLRKLFAKPRQRELDWCWKVGKLVEQWHPASGGRKYSEGVIDRLAEQLQPGGSSDLPGRLQRMQRFAIWLAEHKEAQQLVASKRQDGEPLTWSYVEAVLPLDDYDMRLSSLEKCLAKNLTVEKLTRLARKQTGGKRPSGGRTHAKPESVDEALDKTATLAKKFERWCRALDSDEDVGPKQKEITIEQLPASIQKKLENARQALSELCRAIEAEQPPQKPAKGKAKPQATRMRRKGFSGRSPILRGR